MRYLTCITLAVVVLMALACTAEPTPTPTPPGTPLPKFHSGDASDLVVAHLKTIQGDWSVSRYLRACNCYEYIFGTLEVFKASGGIYSIKEDYVGNGIWEVYIEVDTTSAEMFGFPMSSFIALSKSSSAEMFRFPIEWKVNERTHLVTGERAPQVEAAKKQSAPQVIGELALMVC